MDKIIEGFKKIFNSNNSRKRNIENLIIFLVGLIIIIVASGYIFNKEDEVIVTYNETDIFDPDVFENKLNKILSNIEGAGNVSVMISYKTGVENVPLLNTKDNSTVTEETSGTSVKKIQQGQLETSIIFNQENNGSKEPYISKTLMPQVEGVIVTCDGGGNAKVKSDVIKAVGAVTGVSEDKIQVFQKSVKKR
jgi:stage III sporulation protein AG